MERSTGTMLAAALVLALTTGAAGLAEARDTRRWTETTAPDAIGQQRAADRRDHREPSRRYFRPDDRRHREHREHREHRDGEHRSGRWDRDDRREHWRDHRRDDRRYGDRYYHDPQYRAPGWSRHPPGYSRWKRGAHLPPRYFGRPHVVHDWRHYRLRPPPRGHHWVRVDRDVLLAAVATGLVLDVLYDYF